jgi:hypothetical protein
VWRCCVLQSSYLSRHPLETRRLTNAPKQAHRYRSAVISSVITIAEKRRSPTTLRLSSSISSSEASYQSASNQTYAPLDATRKVLLPKPLPSTSTKLGLPEHYRTTAPGYKIWGCISSCTNREVSCDSLRPTFGACCIVVAFL